MRQGFSFNLKKSSGPAGPRLGEITTARGVIETPVFMPVGTYATVKTLTPEDLKEIGAGIILSNTYHLYLRPGVPAIEALGGLHRFMHWDGPILTDSGGYQIFSLASLRTMSEEGVTFRSHLDGSSHFLTPETVVGLQEALGVDIMICLDECPGYPAAEAEVVKAAALTLRWAVRSKAARTNPTAALFPVVQGGMIPELRREQAQAMAALNFDGYAIGGLSVGEPKELMLAMVEATTPELPQDKPRYLMGVGTPSDLVEAVARGVDMFDCVLPTRLGRHGAVFVHKNGNNQETRYKIQTNSNIQASNPKKPRPTGEVSPGRRIKASSWKLKADEYELINLLKSRYRTDPEVIEPGCGCPACKGGFSKAYISHLIRENEILGLRLATMHNLYLYLTLLKDIE